MSPADPPRKPENCPACGSLRVESLSPAVRDWLCCSACGRIWPRDTMTPTPQEPKIAL